MQSVVERVANRDTRRRSNRRASVQAASVLVALLAWWVVTATGLLDENLVPAPGSTVEWLRYFLTDPEVLNHIRVSMGELAGAFAMTLAIGLPLGYLLGEWGVKNRKVADVGNGTMMILLATPKFVFLPVFLAAFGASYWQKVLYVMLEGIIIVVLALIAAAPQVTPQVRLLNRSLGASKWVLFSKFYFPAVLPSVVEAFRLSVILMMGGVLLAEMYISSAGIGFQMADWGQYYNLPGLFAAVLLVGIIVVLINGVFGVIERRLDSWRIQ